MAGEDTEVEVVVASAADVVGVICLEEGIVVDTEACVDEAIHRRADFEQGGRGANWKV